MSLLRTPEFIALILSITALGAAVVKSGLLG